MTEALDELSHLCQQIHTSTDRTERAIAYGQALAAIPRVQKELKAGRQAEVIAMRADGLTDAEIGERLHLHWARVSAIARGISTGGSDKKRKQPATE